MDTKKVSNPTNADLMRRIDDVMLAQGRIEEKVDNVTHLAEKTNGRVTTIENWKNGIEAIEQYKREQPSTVQNAKTVLIGARWYNNSTLVTAVGAVLLAIAAAISYVAHVKP